MATKKKIIIIVVFLALAVVPLDISKSATAQGRDQIVAFIAYTDERHWINTK